MCKSLMYVISLIFIVILVSCGNKSEDTELKYYDIYNNDNFYISSTDFGLLYLENRTPNKYIVTIKNKLDLSEAVYSFKPFETNHISLYNNSGEHYISLYDLGKLVDRIKVNLDIDFNKLDLSSSYYCDLDKNKDSLLSLIDELELGNLTNDEIVYKVYTYLSNFSYDQDLANLVTSDEFESLNTVYIPDLDAVISNQSGICIDTATLGVGILRTCKIPAKLCLGYIAGVYHAWIQVEYNNEEYLVDSTNEQFGSVNSLKAYKLLRYA